MPERRYFYIGFNEFTAPVANRIFHAAAGAGGFIPNIIYRQMPQRCRALVLLLTTHFTGVYRRAAFGTIGFFTGHIARKHKAVVYHIHTERGGTGHPVVGIRHGDGFGTAGGRIQCR